MDLCTWIARVISDFVDASPDNSLGKADGERAWGAPLVGFARGDDAIWGQLKADIGAFYRTPLDAFTAGFPSASAPPGELSVISWILPQTEATKVDQRQQTDLPSERWVRSRSFGQAFNDLLAAHVVATLGSAGYELVAPSLSPTFEIGESERYGRSSNWSERHAAYVCGLGTFGLCDGLITPLGKAVRCGSVVVRADLPATRRPYSDHHAYCLHYANGSCGICISRCPVGAIAKSGHDKRACGSFTVAVTSEYARRALKLEAYGCGLCQVGVPCESGIPEGLTTSPAVHSGEYGHADPEVGHGQQD